MFAFFKKHATSLLVVLVVIVGLIAYNYFFVDEEADTTTVEVVSVTDPGSDLIAILLRLRGLELNDAVFNSTAFRGFVDFSRELESEGVGRTNPFAPIGQ